MIERTKEEQDAYDKILAALYAIQDLGLDCNEAELVFHIHGLQMFVHQHVLHRLDGDWYSDWYGEARHS